MKEKFDCRGGRKVFLLIAVGIVLIVIGAVCYGIGRYQSLLDRIPRAEHVENHVSQEEIDTILNYNPHAPDSGEMHPGSQSYAAAEETLTAKTAGYNSDNVLNIMVIGQSARPGETYHMADSMILVTVNMDTKTMTLTSFLRDAYLKLPNYTDASGTEHICGYQRLNICYHLGHTFGGTADAMRMLDQCVYENFGVEVDFNVEIGFEGVERVVEYFGGVEVELTEAEADYLNADPLYVRSEVQPGPQVLDGLAALSYARMRKAEGDGESDIKRTERQRNVIESLMEKVKQSDAAGLERIMNAFLPYVVTDMTDEDITRCILELFPIVSELTIETGTCPVKSTYWGEIVSIGGYDSVVLRYDVEENRRIMTALTEGE